MAKVVDLFGDDDDESEGGLFRSFKPSNPKSHTAPIKQVNLFGDDESDDGDGLFGSKPSTRAPAQIASTTAPEQPSKSLSKSLFGDEDDDDDDPLGGGLFGRKP